jgi:signal peptidase complex subunit 2
LSQPNSFQEQHTHTDIRLGLGYASVIIGGGTVFYGWKAGFEPSKTIVTIGVAMCVAHF